MIVSELAVHCFPTCWEIGGASGSKFSRKKYVASGDNFHTGPEGIVTLVPFEICCISRTLWAISAFSKLWPEFFMLCIMVIVPSIVANTDYMQDSALEVLTLEHHLRPVA